MRAARICSTRNRPFPTMVLTASEPLRHDAGMLPVTNALTVYALPPHNAGRFASVGSRDDFQCHDTPLRCRCIGGGLLTDNEVLCRRQRDFP